jgi:hypothetical protein
MKLNNKAMLVTLSVRLWNARKYDRKVSNEVAEKHNASETVGRYNKNLLPVEAPSYKAIQATITKIRHFHYDQTLPWTDEGSRILTAENYFDYTEGMRKLRTEFETNVSIFLPEYSSLKETAKAASGTLYKEDDYPDAGGLKDKFGFTMKILPLPDAGDFRVDLSAGDVNQIKKQIEHDTAEAIQDAVNDLFVRLQKSVSHMVERLTDKDAKFKNTLVSNLQDLCDLVPRLNLTNDYKLEQIRRGIESDLLAYEADDLRDNKKLRKQIAKRAEQIESDLSAFMGGGK